MNTTCAGLYCHRLSGGVVHAGLHIHRVLRNNAILAASLLGRTFVLMYVYL